MSGGRTCIDEIGEGRCTGCFGCLSACSRGAVAMILDEDGFYKPRISRDLCNDCGTCRRRCPVIPGSEPADRSGSSEAPCAFAAWTNDQTLRLASSSGGLFSELALSTLEGSGAVAGCVWGDEWTPEHILTDSVAHLPRMRGSKYVPSRVGELYGQVVDTLRATKKQVLFSGTPCQVAAMARALKGGMRERVLLVDFICHGVPSLRVFHRYLGELFGGERVASFTFRNKSLSWVTIQAESASGRRHQVVLPSDQFGRGFVVEHLFNMEACHACSFARLPRASDITLGDFWGCPEEWNDRSGVSVLLTHSAAGRAALAGLERAGRIQLRPVGIETAKAGSPRMTGGDYPMPPERREFLDGLRKGDTFARLCGRHYPGRWKRALNAFKGSDAKSRFLVAALGRLVGRLYRR